MVKRYIEGNTGVDANRWLEGVVEAIGGDGSELTDLLRRATASVQAHESTIAFSKNLGLEKGVTGYTYHTVPVAIHAWLSHPSDFGKAITTVIQCGGDADTTAAIVDRIVGLIGPRTLKKPKTIQATIGYIEGQWSEMGYANTRECYDALGDEATNLIVEQPGAKRPNDIVLLGAHYDTVSTTPGADDNASAVAVLLEVSRLLQAHTGRRTARYVAFACEEPPYFNLDSMMHGIEPDMRYRTDREDQQVFGDASHGIVATECARQVICVQLVAVESGGMERIAIGEQFKVYEAIIQSVCGAVWPFFALLGIGSLASGDRKALVACLNRESPPGD